METKMVEVDVVSVLLMLNTLGWGIAWLLFRTQFNVLHAKINDLPNKLEVITSRLTKLETQIEFLVGKK